MKTYFLKQIALYALCLFCLFGQIETTSAGGFDSSTPRSAGIGIVLGIPTGVTGKYWLQTDQAVDGGLGFSYGNFVNVYGDYLFHFKSLIGNASSFPSELEPYIGLGGELFISEDTHNPDGRFYSSGNNSSEGVGIRFPIGVEWLSKAAPLGAFVEIVPGLGVIPNTFGFLHAGVGIRYYF